MQFLLSVLAFMGFLGATVVNAGDVGSIAGWERSSGEGNGNCLQYSCHARRSLTGYSPWGLTEEPDRLQSMGSQKKRA